MDYTTLVAEIREVKGGGENQATSLYEVCRLLWSAMK